MKERSVIHAATDGKDVEVQISGDPFHLGVMMNCVVDDVLGKMPEADQELQIGTLLAGTLWRAMEDLPVKSKERLAKAMENLVAMLRMATVEKGGAKQ